ncbi:asparagine-tRNA ligase [Cryptococcus deuterogattii LA55]|nr:asparagine-tRNA ligase [Cryptococcus deuterogattii LA55]KIR95506.1 asparagine-tRNA ligase [Cryptococcus deuterogattii CBS 10090]
MRPTQRRLSSLPPTIRSLLSSRRSTLPSISSTTHLETTPCVNEPVEVNGWIKSVRAHKNVAFLEVSDGTTGENVQAVLKGKNKAEGLSIGASAKLRGRLEQSRGRGQDVELVVGDAQVLGTCDAEAYPIQKKSLPASVLRDNAHLRFRTSQTAAVMRIRDALARDWHDWFESHDFVHVHTPILTGSDCEGAGEVFTIVDHPAPSSPTSPQPFFPHPVHLTVSAQLHLEAPTHALSRTYTLSPSFRAEPSLTSRHLSEFYMLEAEVAWQNDLDGLLSIVEEGVKNVVGNILNGEKRGKRLRGDLSTVARSLHEVDDLESVTGRGQEVADTLYHLRQVVDKPFTRITYTSALELLSSLHANSPSTISPPPSWGQGISTDHEKLLAAHFNGPVFVTRYPKELKPFYMLPTPSTIKNEKTEASRGPTVECFDLLFPHWGEMAGGSLREHRLTELTHVIEEMGMKKEEYGWYLDLRKYGSVPHGGWGMGWDRWVGWVTGMGNVRDVVPYARWKGHCKY